MAKDKGTSTKSTTKVIEEPTVMEPNLQLLNFIKDNKLDFTVEPFTENHVYVPGKGFIFFTKPQLIYKAIKHG